MDKKYIQEEINNKIKTEIRNGDMENTYEVGYKKPPSRLGMTSPRKGIKLSKNIKEQISKSLLGRKLSKKHKDKIKQAIRKRTSLGKRRSDYIGLVPLCKEIYCNIRYKEWRHIIMVRDNFTCCECHKVGGKLRVHHIKSFSSILKENKITNLLMAFSCKEFWNIDNGITLCEDCHKLFHYGYKKQ